jgi:hypothetical protein
VKDSGAGERDGPQVVQILETSLTFVRRTRESV